MSRARRAAVGFLPPGPALRLPPPRALQPSGASLPLSAVLWHRLPAHRHPSSARVLPTSALVLQHGQDHGLVPWLQHRLRQDVVLRVAAASTVRKRLLLRVAYTTHQHRGSNVPYLRVRSNVTEYTLSRSSVEHSSKEAPTTVL